MEIEAKLVVPDAQVFAVLLGMDQIGPFQLVPRAGVERQRNIYYDTPDGLLRAKRYGMRIRDTGERRIATLKGKQSVSNGLFERSELEVEVGDAVLPEEWPASPLRDRVLALLGGAPIVPVLTVATDRRHIDTLLGGRRLAELSLDEGAIHAGARTEPFRELEIELTDPDFRADFEALVALLREHFALQPGNKGKYERGLELLYG
jgi:inorganic triphosphatase YgiF